MLIAGLQYHLGYKASTAIYDATGRLVKQLVLDGDAEIERAIEVGDAKDTRAQQQNIGAVDESVANAGDDGLVCLMRATSPAAAYAISAPGDVVRKIVVRPPTGTGLPNFGIRVVKNRQAVQFGSSYAVVDATTGKRLAACEADKEVVGPIAWFRTFAERNAVGL
jgi:hypothetical protein